MSSHVLQGTEFTATQFAQQQANNYVLSTYDMPQHRIQALHLPDTQNSQFTALLELTVYQPDGQLKRSIHGGREEGSKVRGYIYTYG